MTVAPGQVIAPHDSTVTEVFDDGEFAVVVYESRSGAVLRLQAAVAAVWLAIDGTSTTGEIADELSSMFGEAADVVAPTVATAVEYFWQTGLLEGSQPLQDPEESTRLDFVLPRPPDP